MPETPVPEVLLKLGVDSKGVFEEIDKVNAKYGETAGLVRENTELLKDLLGQEKKLFEARKQTNNPTVQAQYNAVLKETQAKIARVNAELSKQKTFIKESGKEAELSGKALGRAFDATGAITLQKQLKILKAEISRTSDPAELARLAKEAGHIQEEINDATHAVNIFASPSKFHSVGKALGEVGHKILELDFAGAAKAADLLKSASEQITFKDAVKGVKDLGKTLVTVGQSLLKNPLFLLAAAFAAIYEITTGVIESQERYNKVLEEGDEVIKKIVESTKELIRVNRDLALQNEIDAGRVGKVNGEKLKNTNKFIDAVVDLEKQKNDEIYKLNKDFEKAREEDTFRQTKNALNALGLQTQDVIEQKKKIEEITEKYAKQKEELLKQFSERDKKIIIDEANITLAIIKQLTADIKSLKDKNALSLFDDKTISGAQSKAAKLRQIAREQSDLDFKEKTKDLTNQIKINEIQALEQKKLSQVITAINKEERDKIKAIKKEVAEANKKLNAELFKNEIETQKSLVELSIDNASLETNGQADSFSARIGLTIDYYNGLIKLAKENGDSVLLIQEQLTNALNKIDKEKQKFTFDNLKNDLTETQRHNKELLSIQLQDKKESAAILLASDIVDAEAQLAILESSGLATEAELKKQNNLIIELKAKLNAELKNLDKKRLKQVLEDTKTLTDASIEAINKVLNAYIAGLDKQTAAQQKRVDDAAKIAEDGNSQLLELEKKRLEDLNKEKEKFVRAQQALAAVQLIAETAVMVAKAGSEGGAAAAVTIAAAIIALLAGLAEARSIAGQAAFYSGGEGYTGDGNARDTSTLLGKKDYIYHKKEFIFNNETTSKYIQHFRDIHTGKMDLDEIVHHASLYKMLNAKGININREIAVRQNASGSDFSRIESLLRETNSNIKNQDRLSVMIDENGLAIIATSYINQQKRINNLAR